MIDDSRGVTEVEYFPLHGKASMREWEYFRMIVENQSRKLANGRLPACVDLNDLISFLSTARGSRSVIGLQQTIKRSES